MSQSCSIPANWTLPTALAAPPQRLVECLPPEPLSEHQLATLLSVASVCEVWLPVCQRPSNGTAASETLRTMRDVWVEFADRLHAVRYEQPGGGCPLAWYRALRPIETDSDAVIEEPTAGYTRLSERPVVAASHSVDDASESPSISM